MTNYEITYIINPSLDEAAKNELVERFDNILKNDGSQNQKTGLSVVLLTKLVVSQKVSTTS